jgi:hypothetical protein
MQRIIEGGDIQYLLGFWSPGTECAFFLKTSKGWKTKLKFVPPSPPSFFWVPKCLQLAEKPDFKRLGQVQDAVLCQCVISALCSVSKKTV